MSAVQRSETRGVNSQLPKFVEWLDETRQFETRTQQLATAMKEYLTGLLSSSSPLPFRVAAKFDEVISHCDSADYGDTATVIAYSILHFLDRYYRFLLTFRMVCQQMLLPWPLYPASVLDVGTGPAPVLFAASDIYGMLKQYGTVAHIERFSGLEVELDYVEKGSAFRWWLSGFTEHANSLAGIEPWKVPYGGGSFEDFMTLDLTKEKQQLQQTLVRQTMEELDTSPRFAHWMVDADDWWKHRYRYDVIVFSNFLTRFSDMEKMAKHLRGAANALRDRGILIVVGGRGGDYPKIYAEVSRVITSRPYVKSKSLSWCREVSLPSTDLDYSTSSPVGKIISKSHSALMEQLHDLGVSSLNEVQGKEKKLWAVHIYRKIMQPRHPAIISSRK